MSEQTNGSGEAERCTCSLGVHGGTKGTGMDPARCAVHGEPAATPDPDDASTTCPGHIPVTHEIGTLPDDCPVCLPAHRHTVRIVAARESAAAKSYRGPGDFWTQAEWAEWSNRLADLLPEEYDGDAAQEALIEQALTDLSAAATRARAEALLKAADAIDAESERVGGMYAGDCSELVRRIAGDA